MKLNCKGFTLVECLIVVAIIFLLAAIAIPNFIDCKEAAERGLTPEDYQVVRAKERAVEARLKAKLRREQTVDRFKIKEHLTEQLKSKKLHNVNEFSIMLK